MCSFTAPCFIIMVVFWFSSFNLGWLGSLGSALPAGTAEALSCKVTAAGLCHWGESCGQAWVVLASSNELGHHWEWETLVCLFACCSIPKSTDCSAFSLAAVVPHKNPIPSWIHFLSPVDNSGAATNPSSCNRNYRPMTWLISVFAVLSPRNISGWQRQHLFKLSQKLIMQ